MPKSVISNLTKDTAKTISQDELKTNRQMNINQTGIIIQRPVPAQINMKDMQTYIHPLKDVEGMHLLPSGILYIMNWIWHRVRRLRLWNY